MEATRTKSGVGFGQSWRELSHTPTYQVPVVLGSIVALLVGILTYVFDASAASKIVAATPNEAYLVLFGIVGMIGYSVSKQNVQNGSIVAAIAGLALVVLVATQLGLFAGLLLLAGAVWSLASTRCADGVRLRLFLFLSFFLSAAVLISFSNGPIHRSVFCA